MGANYNMAVMNHLEQKYRKMRYKKFKLGAKVQVAECYLNDEVTEHTNTSPTAIVDSEPKDNEELVAIVYDSGEIDFVPQDILEIIG